MFPIQFCTMCTIFEKFLWPQFWHSKLSGIEFDKLGLKKKSVVWNLCNFCQKSYHKSSFYLFSPKRVYIGKMVTRYMFPCWPMFTITKYLNLNMNVSAMCNCCLCSFNCCILSFYRFVSVGSRMPFKWRTFIHITIKIWWISNSAFLNMISEWEDHKLQDLLSDSSHN